MWLVNIFDRGLASVLSSGICKNDQKRMFRISGICIYMSCVIYVCVCMYVMVCYVMYVMYVMYVCNVM